MHGNILHCCVLKLQLQSALSVSEYCVKLLYRWDWKEYTVNYVCAISQYSIYIIIQTQRVKQVTHVCLAVAMKYLFMGILRSIIFFFRVTSKYTTKYTDSPAGVSLKSP